MPENTSTGTNTTDSMTNVSNASTGTSSSTASTSDAASTSTNGAVSSITSTKNSSTGTDVISGSGAAGNAASTSDSSTDELGIEDDAYNLTQEKLFNVTDDDIGSGKGLDANNIKNKGVVFPIIRINDHYFTSEEIRDFYIESGYYKDYHEYQTLKFPLTGFLPTMHLVVKTFSPDLLKINQIKSGDKAAIFFSNGGGMIKSYRADYIINTVVTSSKPSEETDTPVTYIIDGELYIPNLRNESIKFNFNGSSRDAMMDCATRLGLAFYFCDPDDTNDYQGWVCSKNLLYYALDVSSHAWKEFNSFFDAWIDPRYGLSFININKMLIADGFDEPIDLTPFVNIVNKSVGIDGNKITRSEHEKRKRTRPQGKLITNIPRDDESVTPFFIKKWSIVNRASEIAHEIGINQEQNMNIDNPGVDSSNGDVDMNYSIPINTTKLQNGFFILIGPGVNLTYTQADQIDPNQSFVKNSYKVTGGTITEAMSNDDADMMQETGNNMYSSGNTNRFYDAGWEHNMRNNLQLQKQYLDVELGGLNLGIMRGEKIPALIMDNDKMQSTTLANNYTGSEAENALYESASGWYIIDGIMWHWTSIDNERAVSPWDTKVKLVRREWPIPGRKAMLDVDNNKTTLETTVDTSKKKSNTNVSEEEIPLSVDEANQTSPSSASSTTTSDTDSASTSNDTVGGLQSAGNYSSSGTLLASNTNNRNTGTYSGSGSAYTGTSASRALIVDSDDVTSAEEVPLTGLKTDIKEIYYMIKSLCPKIKLVSARRWAVDENGNRVEGNAFVTRNGMYKCANAKGEIMYFKSNNSKHLYGEAFDIINTQGQDFNEIMTKYIMLDNDLLKTMAMTGVAACIEQTTDDSGVASKHYHIGTDKGILKNFWDSVKALNTNLDTYTLTTINNYMSWNTQKASKEITRNNVVEQIDTTSTT